MLSSFKGKPDDAPPPNRSESVCIGAGTVIVGNITCGGPAQFYGHIEGEVRGLELLIGEGAEVVGNVIAREVTIRGRIKGTIRAVRVKLQASGTVEGDIFHRSLSIEDSALFEGSSRRVENPMETAKAPPRPQLAAAGGVA